MATPINSIIWSDLQASIDGKVFAKIGIYVEDRNGSLWNGSRDTILDISIWLQTNKAFTQESGHTLTINGEQKEVLPIQTEANKATIIYFETMSFDKSLFGYINKDGVEVSDMIINVALSNINNFIESFTIAKKESPMVLNSYEVSFIQKFSESNTLSLDNLTMKKYHSIIKDEKIEHPFYLYKVDFEDYMFIINNNIKYKLVSIENETIVMKDGSTFKYNLHNRQSDIITTNKDLSFYLIYEEIKYNITYNGNGGTTNAGATEVILSKDEGAPEFTKEGYNFLGWSYSPSMYGEKININDIPKDKNAIVYAKWEPKDITITYILNDNATNKSENKIFKYSEVIAVSNKVPQLDGYIFLSWKGNDGNDYYPNEIVSLTNNLELTAQWEQLIYTVQYIFPDGTVQLVTFEKDGGFVEEVSNTNGTYKYFSYSINDNAPDKQVGDALENRNHTLYAMIYNQVNIVYIYNENDYTEIKNVYNHGNVLQMYKPRQPMLYIINSAEGERQYFQYWINDAGQIYSPNLYYNLPLTINNDGSVQDITFTAVYGENEYIEHNIFITKDNGISLIAENFQEDDLLTKSQYSTVINDVAQNVEGFVFFKQGEVAAKQFNEIDEKVEYNIGSKETGIFNFNNYIQEAKLKKQLLQISLNMLDGNNLGYVVLEDYDGEESSDPLDTAENDIYISL